MNIEKFFNSNKKLKSRITYIICGVLLLIGTLIYFSNPAKSYSLPDNILNDRGNVPEQMIYLSDIEYSKASVGWGTLTFDKTQDNGGLTLKLDGYSTVFKKGIWAHATSTIEYDISEYKDYAYFTTYYGLNTTANNTGNGVKFYIYTSVDGNEWTLRTEENPEALKGVSNAKFAKIDIRDANYIKLYAYDNGKNASDHAVWADCKLIKENYTDDITIPVTEFDNYIKENYTSGTIPSNLQLPLLQRTFISRIGQYTLRSFVDASPENYEMLRWFINNEEALRLWLVGGTPNGTYERALQVLSNLYHAHKEDLENENLTPLGNKYKDLYLKMMLALSLTHSTNIGLWVGGNQLSDAVTRYEIYKDMHLNNLLLSNKMFESYTVEEMRWVMHVNIDDEEIKWLRDFSLRIDPVKRFTVQNNYFPYTKGYSYARPQYYSAENYEKWDAKYNLSKYNITYQAGKPKLWIVFEEGAVCGGISKTSANLYGVWGVPASVVGQPAHAAYIYYYDVGGKGAWQLSYNVAATGWANTGGYTRMPNDWGNLNSGVVTSGANIKSASYFFLSQEAQNEYEKYEKAKLITFLASIYSDDRAKLERIYRDTLAVEIINWDAWLGLVNLYITDPTKTEEDLINLAEEIASALTYHPLPMYDLTRRIGTKLTSSEYKGRLMIIQNRTLKKAKTATGANTLQYKEVPVVAQALLGEINSEIATFSFSGTDANKIVLSKQLQSTQVYWEYSLDGGHNWTPVSEHSVTLSAEEIASITVTNDIKVHINGLPLNEANIYTIDITKRSFPSGIIAINDEEDRLLNATRDMEWSLNPSEGWNSFATTNPLFSGNVRVYVRVIAAGTQLASDPVYYTFTENNTDDEAWYIQSKNLKVVEVNGTGGGNYNNILDGNVNTYWRSYPGIFPAYVTIKLDQPRYISGIDYVPDKSATNIVGVVYGIAKKLNVYVSMDGSSWELAASKDNLGENVSKKTIDFPEAKKAMYVKVECESIYPPMDAATKYKTFTVSVIKLYENVLANENPRADVNYNIVSATNQNVTAELVNLIRPITVTNNGGSTSYTFTENGEFTFEFVDADGNKGTATATVNWIDKTIPTVDVSFNTTAPTNDEVVATLNFSKDNITVLNKDIQIAENPDNSKTITFDENNTVELEFMDSLGNIGRKTITVSWIDKTPPTAEVTYSTLHLTDKPVTVELNPSEPITVTNNGGKTSYTFNENGEFTFEFIDRAGNQGTAKAIVNWIAKMPQYELTYSTTNPTKDDVEVTLTLEEGYRVVNNDANNKYIFTDNGTFGFQYIDRNGIVGEINATVTWIDKVAPTAELKYDKTKDKVTVTVINPSEEITFKEGNGVYEFTENGSYEIVFYDKVGNIGTLTAVIDTIGKEEQPEEPDKPDIPDVPEEPDKPDIPDEPDEPDNPENPGTTEPENPDKPNEGNNEVPDIPSKPVAPNEPTNPNKPTDKPNNDNNETGKYQIYTINNIDVKIPSEAIKEKGTLYINSFEVIEDIRQKFGPESEYYDIYLTNDLSERIALYSAEPIKINIKINTDKEFIGVYEITNDNTIKPVDYVKDGDSIELSTKELGKYVVSYKEEKILRPSKSTEKNKKQGIIWIMLITIIGLFGLSIYVFQKKNNK